jgi:hypothetical protein
MLTSALERCVYSASITMVAKLVAVLDVEPAALLERAPQSPPRATRNPRSRLSPKQPRKEP